MKKGWQTKTIGDVCEFQRGLTYAKGDEVDVSDNVVLRATNIHLATNLLIFDELKYISDKVVVPESKKVKQGSLMICMASGSKSHLGKVAFIDDDYGYAFGGFMGMLTPRNGLLPKYLFHLMTSEDYKDFIGALSDGANINNLTFDNLKRFPVPVPPLAEQQRIVGLLDEAFEGLATAKANAEKNLQNARALFESHLNSVFTKRGEGWQTKTLGELCAIELGRTPARANASFWDETRETSNVWLSIADLLKAEDNVVVDSKEYVSDKGAAICKLVPKGTLLVSFKLTLGRLAFAGRDLFTNEAIAALTIFSARELSKEFLFYCLTFFDWVKAAENDVKLKGMTLNKAKLKVMPVSFPPLAEQQRIVGLLDALSEETQRLARLYVRKHAALEALKKSLLHQAFTGEL